MLAFETRCATLEEMRPELKIAYERIEELENNEIVLLQKKKEGEEHKR